MRMNAQRTRAFVAGVARNTWSRSHWPPDLEMEDVVQGVLLRLWQEGLLDPDGALVAEVPAIVVRRRVIDELRGRQAMQRPTAVHRLPVVLSYDRHPLLRDLVPAPAGPSFDLLPRLRHATATLHGRPWAVFWLVMLGVPQATIAACMAVTESRVSQLYRGACRAVRAAWHHAEEDHG